MKKLTDNMIRELATICTCDEAGKHFTQTSSYYLNLEKLGLVKIGRPVHEFTGIAYSCEHWSIEVTEDGQAVVDTNPELCPE